MLGVFSLWGGLLLLHIPVFICVTDPVNEEEGKALPSLRKSEESSFMFSATNKNTPCVTGKKVTYEGQRVCPLK